MTSYARPSIDAPVFRDADGQIIDYGNRWHGSPPEDTYSVDTHPERFAPIHIVADALITYLRHTYDVEVDENAETATDLLRPAYHAATVSSAIVGLKGGVSGTGSGYPPGHSSRGEARRVGRWPALRSWSAAL